MAVTDFLIISLFGVVLVCLNQALVAYRTKRNVGQIEASLRATAADFHAWSAEDDALSRRIKRTKNQRGQLKGMDIYTQYHELSVFIIDDEIRRLLLRQSFTNEDFDAEIGRRKEHRDRLFKKREAIVAEGYPRSMFLTNQFSTVQSDNPLRHN